jgi:glutamyl-tRNA reductase
MLLAIPTYHNSLNNFCIVGINYRKSDTSIRGRFSLSVDRSVDLLQQALAREIPGCMVLSTCNRTEVYGICRNPHELIELLCEHTHCQVDEFMAHGYIYKSNEAIEHLFKVASGLDSQIIGDYEILAQLKLSAKIAKQHGCINSTMERVINYALQASKDIKTKTKLSSGTVSVSYAAIEIIKERIKDIAGKKILLAGTGKFGNHIAKNLKEYLGNSSISFTNRTDEKAFDLAVKYEANFVPYKNLSSASNDADVIIVNSSAEFYTILPSFFTTPKPRLVLDLSVPQNVHPEVKNIEETTLLNVDEVSLILDRTMALRHAEISNAMTIINATLEDLLEWHRQQSNSPFLHQVKSQLYQLSEIHVSNNFKEEKIHKAVSSLAIQLKHKTNKGCQCINTLNSYLQMNYESSS